MIYPRDLTLKPPRSLRLAAFGLVAGAVFLCASVPDFYALGCGLLMMTAALMIWRAASCHAGQRIVLLADRGWIPPGATQAYTLSGSSAELSGVFWLHGRSENGGTVFMMAMPDAFSDADAYRSLCVWFRLGSASLQ